MGVEFPGSWAAYPGPMGSRQVATFHWKETQSQLNELSLRTRLTFDRKRGVFFGSAISDVSDDSLAEPSITVVPPRAVPLPPALAEPSDDGSAQAFARRVRGQAGSGPQHQTDLDTYLRSIPTELPLQCMILAQAGAVAIAMFRAGKPVSTKAFKRYVVRGTGRAQPTYMAAKGKSRYGARLRMQNARLLIEETNERLNKLWNEYGAPHQILVGAPQRLWADLFLAPVRPPFTKETPITKVPVDVDVPTTSVLLRTYRSLLYGRIETN